MAKTTRTPLMAGNWKMNLNHQEAVVLVQKLAWTLSDKRHDYGKVEVVVVPPFTDIRSVQTLVDGDRLQVWRRHKGPVWSVAFTPDGRALLSGGADGLVISHRVDAAPPTNTARTPASRGRIHRSDGSTWIR